MTITLAKNINRSQLKLLALDCGGVIRIHRTRLDGSLVPESVDEFPVLVRRESAYDAVTPREWSRVVTLWANFYDPARFAWTVLADDIRTPGRTLLGCGGVEGAVVRRVNHAVLIHERAERRQPEGAVRHA